jgi:dTDP-4-amino-4,6-dideoxygalactose transaminase
MTSRTKAIVPVHLYGQPAHMAAVRAFGNSHGLSVIEDACQAHGASEGSGRAGTLGDAAAFSFYPAKNLGAHGDGGIIVTNDDSVAHRLRLLRNYGAEQKYRSDMIGFNRRLDTLQAAMLRVKLPHLDEWNAARRERASLYDALLADLPVTRPVCREGVEHVWHLYVIRVADRERVRQYLDRRRIETGIHYPVPVHLQPAYRTLGHRRGDFPVAERYADQILSLPMYPELPLTHILRVAEALSEALCV